MKICVLGAGVAGMTSAYFLAHAGHDVTVVERNSGVGLETSYANGGQLSCESCRLPLRPGHDHADAAERAECALTRVERMYVH
jgi:D-amino-acid dehydrogenase